MLPFKPRLPHAAAAALALVLAACAAGGPDPEAFDVGAPPGSPGAPSAPPGASRPALFISPHGQPFRSRAGEPYPVAVWFAQADRDHDGRISLAEFRADAEAFFRSLDTNHDGVVDGFEVGSYEQSMPEMTPRVAGLAPGEGQDLGLGAGPGGGDGRRGRAPGGGGSPRGPRRGQIREGASPYTFLDQPEPVLAADADFDSKVTLAEALAAADRRFAILDTNSDGYLTLAELPRTAAQQALERGQRRPSQSRPPGGDPPRGREGR